MGSTNQFYYIDCTTTREGKHYKEICHKNSQIAIVQGLLEEFSCQCLINLDVNPSQSMLRKQAYNYVTQQPEVSDINPLRNGTMSLETLTNKVFISTDCLLNWQISAEITADELAKVFDDLFKYANDQQGIWQIGVYDLAINELTSVTYEQYAAILINAVLCYLNTSKEPQKLLSFKILCSTSKNQKRMLKELMAADEKSKDGRE